MGDCDRGGDEWAEEVQLTKQAVEAINKLQPRPRFVVLCGDLTHAMPGEMTVLTDKDFNFDFTMLLPRLCIDEV